MLRFGFLFNLGFVVVVLVLLLVVFSRQSLCCEDCVGVYVKFPTAPC